MGYEHPNTTTKTESDEIIKSGVEKLVPIPNEREVTSEDKRECDVLVCEDSSTFDVCDNHSKILSDSNIDDDISSDDNAFEDIEYVEASLPDPEIVRLEEENVVYHEEEEIEPDQEILTSAVKNDISDNSTNDPLLDEVDLFLASNNSIPLGIENFAYDSKGDIRFLKDLLIYDSIPFPVNESFDYKDDPSFSGPPPEPPDAKFDFELDAGEEISVVMNDNDELECLDPRDEIDVKDDNYFPFIFVIRIFLPYLIYPKVFSLLLSAESEDTIFDPGISV
nr:hypothetical protein [Tanacetum cinerariifolium]